jgi:hypothetical protein
MTPITPDPAAPGSTEERSRSANGTPLPELDPELIPNLDNLVTVDHTPVDSIFTEKQQRLLIDPLYSSWAGPGEGQSFLALSNVGWFYLYREPPVVPDFLLSLDVAPAGDILKKEGHSYYQWAMGKPPEVVVEVVSDRRGGEDSLKMRLYARLGVLFYAILDPENCLGEGLLRTFVLERKRYEPGSLQWMPEVGLGLTLWTGNFEGQHLTWLRWCDQNGNVLPTGRERAEEERRRADEKIERLAAQLRALGAKPEV